MSDVTDSPKKLRWLPADEYHTRSECGRFTVARRRVSGEDWYIAYHREPTPATKDTTPRVASIELAAARVTVKATDAERAEVIRRMKAVCEAAA
jgi:hypothetical protein